MYSETLFVSISNLFLIEFLLEWCFCILNKTINFSHFCDSSCIQLSFSLLPFTFAFSFAEKIDILIEFFEVKNASFFYIL